MINGMAEQNLLLMLTEKSIDEGDELIERHNGVQRDCAEHAEQLGRLCELHARIGEMLARERRRFGEYFPQQQQQPPAARLPHRPPMTKDPAHAKD